MFRWRKESKIYFGNIITTGGYASSSTDNKSKFIMFDPFYYCALIGMAAVAIDQDESDDIDLVERYPEPYRNSASTIAGLLIATEAKRLGLETHDVLLEKTMVEYISHDTTLLSDKGIKMLNAYSRKGVRIFQDFFPDKPLNREEFLERFYFILKKYA